ncbi:MAG: PAS domain S-box protein, partial [Bacteroidia bacterium]|nr:PAS domain S-box protein [Bacteroidia bacterium]
MSISSLRFPIIIRMAATWAIVVGVWVIIGWILGQEAMKTSLKDGSTMKFNTAICSILCGLTIWMQTFENPKIRRIGKVFPIIFVCLSFLSLFQTYFNVNLGIDELVFTDYVSRAKGLPHPGRTSTALSITFLFLGLGLIKYDSSNLWERKVSQWAFHAVSVFTFIFILSYLYEVPYLSKILIIGTMTLHSAVLTFSLSIICSLFNDDLAFTGLFLENTSGSRMARRIFPGVMVTIILLGLFRASTISKESLIGVEFGIALFSIGFMVIGLLILSISSYYLNQMEERKNDAEESLRQLNKDLELTIRKRTLELNQLNERFNLATSGAKVGVWDISIKDRRVVGNQVFYEIWGFPPDTKSILLDDLSARIHPEDREKTLSKFWEVATQKSRIDFEHRILVDGHEKYIKVSGAMEYDENGVAFRGVGIHTDITAQKLLEHDLKVSYEQIKTFIEEAPTALAMFDKEIRYLSVSKRWLQDYGLVGTNVIGRSHYEVFPEIGEDWKRIHQNCLNGERDVNTGSPFYRADGSVQWLSWVVCPWYVSEGEVGGILMHTVDITAERVHMEKLRQSEEKYHKMVEEVEDYAILLLDNEGKITNWNKGAELIKGYQTEDILGKSHKQFYTEEDILQGLPEHLLKKARIEGKVQDEGWRVKKDGTMFWASISITALSDRNGNTIGFSKLTKDITHKKLAEDKLKKAKE